MTLAWSTSIDDIDWDELSALYRAAPLGDKKPAHLRKVFGASLFTRFVREDGRTTQRLYDPFTLEEIPLG